LKKAALGAAAGCATLAAPAFAQESPAISWRLASSFPRTSDASYSGGENVAEYVSEATAGKFQISAFPASEILPALRLVAAVLTGRVERADPVPYYYFGKVPAVRFDGAFPFGLNTRQYSDWVRHAGGLQVLREPFAKYNILNFPCGYTGT